MKNGFQLLIPIVALVAISSACTQRGGWTRVASGDGAAAGPAQGVEPLTEAELERRIEAYARFSAGLIHDLNDQPDLARDEYSRSALANPSYEPIVIEAARRHIQANEPSKALDVLRPSAARPDASGTLFAWLGMAHSQAGNLREAIAAHKKAIEKDPNALIAYQGLSHIYLSQEKTKEAIEILDRATQLDSIDSVFIIEVAGMYARFADEEKNDDYRRRAVELLDRAAGGDLSSPLVLQRLAEAFAGLDEHEKAEKLYVDLLERSPNAARLRSQLVELYLRSDQKDKAAEQLELLSRQDPSNPQTHYLLGALASERQDFAAAEEHFDRALLLSPGIEPLYYELAGIKLTLNKPRETLELLDRARSRFSLSFPLEFYSGIARMLLEDYTDAVQHLTSAEVLAKTSDPSRLNPLFYYQFGAALERSGDHDSAEQQFKKALEIEPDYAEALNYLGYMWTELGRNLSEARAMIEKAVRLQPDNAAFLDSMAWVLFKLDQPREALDWMLKAVEKSEDPDPTLYDHLGDIYSALDRPGDARDAWRKATEIEANPSIEAKINSLTPANTDTP